MPEEKLRKTEKTRRRIMEAYLTLMEAKPYDKITVSELIRQAQLTRSTFYVYFADVPDLLEKLETELLEGIHFHYAAEDTSVESDLLLRNLEIWIAYCKANSRAFLTLIGENGDPLFARRIRRLLNEHFIRTMELDGLPNDELRPYFAEFLAAANIGVLLHWLQSGDTEISPRQLACISNMVRYAAKTDDGHLMR